MNYEIRPERTSPPQKEPNQVMREYVTPFLKNKGCKKILDFGSGYRCKDSVFLSSQGFDVSALELPSNIERMDLEKLKNHGITNVSSQPHPKQKFDTILLNYVLNVVPYKPNRDLILHQVNHCLKPNGYAVITVRQGNFTGEKFNDGYLMGKGKIKTFQKLYSENELVDSLLSYNLKPIKRYKKSNLTFIVQKTEDDILYGQTLANPKNISKHADYLQVSINNKDITSVDKLLQKLPDVPLFLHGDYGNAERDNSIFDDNRVSEIIDIVKMTQKSKTVYGLTMHSPRKAFMKKNKKTINELTERIRNIQKEINANVTLEHRSANNFAISSLEEILKLGDLPLTIDIPALFIASGYNKKILQSRLEQLNNFNVTELHLGDSIPSKQQIGAVIGKGVIPYKKLQLPPSRYRTIEVISAKGFEESVKRLKQACN